MAEMATVVSEATALVVMRVVENMEVAAQVVAPMAAATVTAALAVVAIALKEA